MKLLVCATEYYPHGSGIANVAYNVVKQLEKKGVDCTICSPTGPDIIIEPRFKSGRLAMLSYWHQVSDYFKHGREQYDLAWLHYPLMLGPNPFKTAFVTIHSTAYGIRYPLYLKPYQMVSTLIERYCLNKLDENIPFSSVSTQSILDLRANGIVRNKLVKIINGAELKRFSIRPDKEMVRKKFGLPINSRIFLSVGRLTYHKKPFRMIDLFKRIQSHSDDCYLVVVGGGKLLTKLKKYSQKNDVRAIFLGYVGDEELPELYACADYFFMTSIYEGGEPTLTVAEAMASGLPCIASRLPNFEFIEENSLGLLFHPSDDDVAESEIMQFLTEENTIVPSDVRGYARQNLDWNLIAGKYYEEFCSVMNRTSGEHSHSSNAENLLDM